MFRVIVIIIDNSNLRVFTIKSYLDNLYLKISHFQRKISLILWNEHRFKIKEDSKNRLKQGVLCSSYIMKILIFKAVTIIVGILLSCAQACKSTQPKGWYLKVRKAEYEAKVKDLEAAKARENDYLVNY